MIFGVVATTAVHTSQILNNLDQVAEFVRGSPSPDAQQSKPVNGSTVKEHTKAHTAIPIPLESIRDAQQSIAQWVLLISLMMTGAILLFAVPFAWQHYKTLSEIRRTQARLKDQALTLRATHKTIENMLEDIIHEKKQASRTSEINARLASIINSADDAIFSLNLAGYITTANEAALRTFDEHCEGKLFLNLFPAAVGARLKSLLMSTAEQNSGSTLDITLEQKKQRMDLSLTISPIHADQQQVIGFSVIAKDISNTKLEEERFRLAVEAAPNAMIMINQHGFIVLVNSEAEAMFGYTRDELVTQPIHQLVPASLRSLHNLHMQNYLENPDRRNMGQGYQDLQGQRKNGDRFPIEVGLTPITIDADTYVISSIVDISERIEQQRALKNLNIELRRKNQEMEQFIYTVSHDLKAPLVTIAGFANRLKAAKDLNFNDDHHHKLDRILANVRSMESLLQDLLHLSRVIKRDLEKSQVDTTATLQNVLDSLEGTLRKTGATITVVEALPSVYAQESLLFQCLQNIISNALKYTKPDVKPEVRIGAVKEAGYSGVRIADNGIGIAEQHQERIFNVFERLNPDVAEGSGVGLSIVKTIMEKHSGKISLTSRLGEGTEFTLLFPDIKRAP